MKYFLDNCISFRLGDALRALGVDIVPLREEFPEDTKDIPLFRLLAGRDIVFVSTNTSQLTREHEARALKQAGVSALYFGPFYERMKFWEQAIWIVSRWPRIDDFATKAAKGTCAEIKQNGRAMIYPM